jgi:hypothetical protein
MPPKRPRPEDPSSPSRRLRSRLSSRAPGLLPTPDDTLSVATSAAPPTSDAEEKVPAGPPNPGVVRARNQGVLSRLPPDSDVLDAFAKMRMDGNLSDEQAFIKLMTAYDVSIATLNQISSNVSPTLLHRQLICVINIIDDPQPQSCQHRLVTSNMRT